MSNKPLEFRPSGTIEFEQIEITTMATPAKAAATAAAVDETMDTDPLSINFGRKKDHKPSPGERMLAGSTIDWLVAFPAAARPKALCERFPHVANRLARDWAQKAVSAQSLEALVGDTRWGGTGFPAQVHAELKALLNLLAGAAQPV
jgi:hypothetical protein